MLSSAVRVVLVLSIVGLASSRVIRGAPDSDKCSPGQMFYKECNLCTCGPSGQMSLSACTYKGCGKREVGGTMTRGSVGSEMGGFLQEDDDPMTLYLTDDFRGIDRQIDEVGSNRHQ